MYTVAYNYILYLQTVANSLANYVSTCLFLRRKTWTEVKEVENY